VTTQFIDENVTTVSWFEAEGMSSGLVTLLYSGPAIGYLNLPPYIEDANVLQYYTFTYFGPDALGVRPGLCGAPVVHEKDDECDGAVIGFVWLNEGRDCIVAALDDLMEAGWRLSQAECRLIIFAVKRFEINGNYESCSLLDQGISSF
jgi:hypothetical protein